MEKHWPSLNYGDLSTSTTADVVLTQVVVPVVIGVIVALGLVGNLSVITVVAANLQMRNSANTLIASLAVVDLIFCVFCLPVIATVYGTNVWPFGNVWCKVCRLLILVRSNCALKRLSRFFLNMIRYTSDLRRDAIQDSVTVVDATCDERMYTRVHMTSSGTERRTDSSCLSW